jgi:cell fate regulator YaaT (PSP1 superfamily)
MGCSSCSSGGGLPNGCKNNGACGTYGCNKLEVFDWLVGMELPESQKPFDIVEVRFKNSRKGFYRNASNLELYAGDVVVVDVSPGFDVGVVSLTGELVRVQMRRKEIKDNYEVKKLIRKAKEEDIEKWQDGRKLEQNTMMRARTIARELHLEMKLSDVEYQGDKTKATFYYTADDRVDFRELIRRYAEEFKVRIDMRQIGYRYEAGRLGGIGSCGRELCCSSWLTDFRAVSTSAARYQQLSLNPTKLAGQCGKLKCCLNFELDQYVEATKDFPSVNTRLHLPKGVAVHFKTDIFQRIMYFIYEGQPGESPFPLTIEAIREIADRNRKGIVVEDVEEFMEEEVVVKETDFAEVVGQDSLTRFDRKKGRSPQRSRDKGPRRDGDRPQNDRPQGERTQGERSQSERPPQERRQGDRPQNDRPQQGGPRRPDNRGGNQRPPQKQGENPQAPRELKGGAPREPRPKGTPPQQGQSGQGPQQPRKNPPNRPQGNNPNRPQGGPRDNRPRGNDGQNNPNTGKSSGPNTPPQQS